MGSIWSNLKLSNELLDDTLDYYGVTRNTEHTYQMRDGSDGFRLIERDKDDNIVNVYRTPVGNYVEPNSMTESMTDTINYYRGYTKRHKQWMYMIILIVAIAMLLAIITIVIGRGG